MLKPRYRAGYRFYRTLLISMIVLLSGTVTVTFAAANDNNVQWNELGHNSRDTTYRTPSGSVPTGSAVKIRLRAALNDLTGVQMRLWNDRLNQQSFVNLTKVATDDTYEWWEYTLNVGNDPTAYYYRFIAQDGSATAYYQDDDQYGGWGNASGSGDDFKSWQLTVYDPTFQTPDWVKNAVIYQIFPDRFRDGDSSNNTPAGTFFYGEAGGTISRSLGTNWNTVVCDPRLDSNNGCEGSYSRNFYGGDLQGVIDKLPYLADLGVTAIYFNPIFESPSNHKYDTTDYSIIDDNFGDLALFEDLAEAADNAGIHLILDGVFNHTSSDSHYFDRYDRYDDFTGACENVNSIYRDWYYFTASPTGPCAGPANYESWFGYDSLPKLQANSEEVRSLIWSEGTDSIAPYWMQWADGWRLDVGGDVDPGVTNDPNNSYWEGFRNANRLINPDTYIVGEEWGNATPWLLGTEWDATMNYQYSSIILSFWRDTPFSDNDHNSGSSAGELNPISPSVANERLLNWKERYPAEAYYAMMNLLGSHDTSRALFMLDHGHPANPAEGTSYPANANHDWSDAITRLKGVALMQMTLPGAPTIYYGDEIGLVGPQTWSGGKWEDDPYNRQPYPWLDETGTPFYTHLQSGGARDQLLAYHTTLVETRNNHPALRTGSFDPLLMQDFPDDPLYVYGRKLADNSDAAIVMINRSTNPQNMTVNVAGYLPVGATFDDALTPAVESYTVNTSGDLTAMNVPARSGALLVLTSGTAQTPAAVTDLNAASGQGVVNLTWSAAADANNYDVYRSVLTGGGYEFVGNTASTNFDDTTVTNGIKYYYVVVSKNSATGLESGWSNEASAIPQWDLTGAYKNLQFPFTITHTISTTNPTEFVYGQLYIGGATDAQDTPIAGIRAQVGFGANNSTPDDTWTWSEMVPNPSYDFSQNNDEYQGTMLPSSTGEFDYTVRYSSDNGATWHYATEREGGGSPIGDMTVNPSSDQNDPSVPANLTVTGTTSASISLAWEASVDTRSGRALDSYRIYRATLPGNDFAMVGSVDDGMLTYTDTAVTTGTGYKYYVTALDDSFNESAPSNIVEATAEDVLITVTFITTVPAGTPDETIYIVGNQDVWGPWNPGLVAMTETSPNVWEWSGEFLTGTSIEYKHTRGDWDKVEKDADGFAEISHTFTVEDEGGGEQTIEITLLNWRDPHVIAFSPADGATGVASSTTITTTWNKDIDFNAETFGTRMVVTDSASAPVAGVYAWDNTTNVVTFTPDAALADGDYTVTVSGVTASGGGDQQKVNTTFSFSVGEVVNQVELLANGDMELATNNIPDGWTGKNLTKDKVKCNKENKVIAYSGLCALQFKGSAGEKSKFYQDIDLSGVVLTSGDTLNFVGYVHGKGKANGTIKLKATYTDSTATTKGKVKLVPTSGYEVVNASLSLAGGNDVLDKIRVQLINKSVSGKIRLDALSLTKGEAAFGSGLVPLP